MREDTHKRRDLQCDLRTALGPGTQYIGVTEAILSVVACTDRQRSQRYCDTPNTDLDRRRRLVT